MYLLAVKLVDITHVCVSLTGDSVCAYNFPETGAHFNWPLLGRSHRKSFFFPFRDDICFDLWEYHGVHVNHYCYSDHSIGVLHPVSPAQNLGALQVILWGPGVLWCWITDPSVHLQ